MKDILNYFDFYPNVLSESQKMSIFVVSMLTALFGTSIWLGWNQSQQSETIQLQYSFIDTLRVQDSIKNERLIYQEKILLSQKNLIAVLLAHDSARMAEDIKKKAAWDSWNKQHQIDIQQHEEWQKEWDKREK